MSTSTSTSQGSLGTNFLIISVLLKFISKPTLSHTVETFLLNINLSVKVYSDVIPVECVKRQPRTVSVTWYRLPYISFDFDIYVLTVSV